MLLFAQVMQVHPAIVEGPRIKVRIAVFWAHVAKGRLGLGLSDWADVLFRFDCSNGEFRVDHVECGGI